jgi:hypothetical protein
MFQDEWLWRGVACIAGILGTLLIGWMFSSPLFMASGQGRILSSEYHAAYTTTSYDHAQKRMKTTHHPERWETTIQMDSVTFSQSFSKRVDKGQSVRIKFRVTETTPVH